MGGMKLIWFRAPVISLLLPFLAFAADNSQKKNSEIDKYETSIAKWQQERQTKLRADDGWLSLAGLFWLKEGENIFGSAQSNDIELPDSVPAKVGTLVLHQNHVSLTSTMSVPAKSESAKSESMKNPGTAILLNGKPLAEQSTELHSDANGGAPDKVQLGSLTITIISRGDKLGVRVRDKDSKARKDFNGLSYYPIDPKLRIVADFIPYTPPKKIPIPTVLGTTVQEPSHGRVELMLDGKKFSLEPVIEDADALFFIFKDTTAGLETYGAGRFLYTENPRDGKIVLDFNKAENPPCAFTPYATCPLPPPQNRLPVAVRAGEKKYGNH